MEKNIKIDRDYVTYEDFGAVGDGKTEDFGAICKAHEYANEHRLTVKGTPGKTYYIKDTKLGTDEVHVAVIKTNVDWCGANFIIDDTNLTVMKNYPEEREIALKPIFKIVSEDEHKPFKIEDKEHLARIAAQGLNQKTKKIDLGIDWDGPVMIIPSNSAHGVFRRRGTNQYNGAPMRELIIVDKDGNVSPETPIMFSYANIDSIDVYKLDPRTAITIENGVFTTLESRVNHHVPKEDGTFEYIYHGYIVRGLSITRSYTTVKNVQHIAKGGYTLLDRAERNLEGAMYSAFFSTSYADRITFKDCRLQGRTSPGTGNGHSSYDFAAGFVNKVVLDGCVQSNFWVTIDPVTFEIKSATEYDKNAVGYARKTSDEACSGMGVVDINGVVRRLCWGVGGTNFCKNMEYINSTLTRFDAHQGLYNGKVINSNVTALALTGYGDMIVEDSNYYEPGANSSILSLRGDYGHHWSGDIILKNVKAYLLSSDKVYIAKHNFANWYFGYTCAFPSIAIDNLRFFDQKTEKPLKPGLKGYLFKFGKTSECMHLDDAKAPAIFPVNDYDGDGYIDEPRFISDADGTFYPERDLDGDGRVGNTSLKYDDYVNGSVSYSGGLARSSYFRGAEHPTCTANLNKIRPPKYFKVLNNKDENGEVVCKYFIKDTAGVSDGGWYRDADTPDTMGGFFGGTEFHYGDGEFFVGTENKNGISDSLVFVKEYDE